MTIRIVHVGAGLAMAGLAALAACNQGGGGDTHLALTGSKYCTPFASTSATNSAAGLAQTPDPATGFDDCVHRWAYALAPARDPADVVAQASVDACGAALNAWSQQTQGPAGEPPTSSRGEQSQQSSAVAQQMRGAEARALFYVVQARAAGCAPPAANTLSASPPPT